MAVEEPSATISDVERAKRIGTAADALGDTMRDAVATHERTGEPIPPKLFTEAAREEEQIRAAFAAAPRAQLAPVPITHDALEFARTTPTPMLIQGSVRGEKYMRDVLPLGIPGMIAGPPGAGKTWFALDLAWRVASGTPLLGAEASEGRAHLCPAPGRRKRVLVLALEDDRAAVLKRLAAIVGPVLDGNASDTVRIAERNEALANLELIAADDLPIGATHLFDIETGGAAKPASLFEQLEERARTNDYALIVIDTFAASCMGDVETSASAATHVVRSCGALGSRDDGEPGPTVLLLHHTRKGALGNKKDKKAVEQAIWANLDAESIRGSSAILGSIRWAGMLTAVHGVPATINGKDTRRTHVFFRVAKVNGCAMFPERIHLVHGDGGELKHAAPNDVQRFKGWDPAKDENPQGGEARPKNNKPKRDDDVADLSKYTD